MAYDDPWERLTSLGAAVQRVREGPSQVLIDVLHEITAASRSDAALLVHARNEAAFVAFSTDPQFLGLRLSLPIDRAMRERGFRNVVVQPVAGPNGVWALACVSNGSRQIPPLPRSSVELIAALLAMLHESERPAGSVDALTLLPDRAKTLDRLREVIASAERGAVAAALLFIDLNDFKAINDTQGHTRGDAVLRSVAQRMRQTLRAGEFIGRVGGDEFCVILPQIVDVQQAGLAAQRLCDVVANADEGVTLSIGIALIPKNGNEIEQLLTRADAAMYRAKRARSSYCFYDEDWTLELEKERAPATVPRNIERDFTFSLQPILDVRANRVVRAEMFPRSTRLDSPGESADLDVWVLSRALNDAEQLRQALSLEQVHVNVRVDGDAMLTRLVEAIESAPAQARSAVSVELNGSAGNTMGGAVKALTEAGLRVGLDNLEAWPFTVRQLQEWNLSFVKFSAAKMDTRLIEATTALGYALGWNSIATQVETKIQKDLLTTLGVQLMQGFYFAPAMTRPDLRQWLAARAAVH